MKKLVFISDMAFDANMSLIKELRNYYNVYYFTKAKTSVLDAFGICEINENIFPAELIPNSNKFDRFLNLQTTYLYRNYEIKKKPIVAFFKKLKIDVLLCGKVKKINPDLVLTDTYKNYITNIFFKRKLTMIVHDPFPHSGEDGFLVKLSRMFIKYTANKFLLLNKIQFQPFIDKLELEESKVGLSFLSVYEYYHLFRSNNIKENGSCNILFWGRISPYKGIEYLIKGFLMYQEENKGTNVSLTIAGGGSFNFDIDQYVTNNENIHVINRYLPVSEMVELIQQSTIVACPYIDATQSGVIMTAFAFKKPVLATMVGGLPEMLKDGKMGVLVEPADANALCRGIDKMLGDKDALDQFKDNIDKYYWGHGERSWNKAVSRMVSFMEN